MLTSINNVSKIVTVIFEGLKSLYAIFFFFYGNLNWFFLGHSTWSFTLYWLFQRERKAQMTAIFGSKVIGAKTKVTRSHSRLSLVAI